MLLGNENRYLGNDFRYLSNQVTKNRYLGNEKRYLGNEIRYLGIVFRYQHNRQRTFNYKLRCKAIILKMILHLLLNFCLTKAKEDIVTTFVHYQ